MSDHADWPDDKPKSVRVYGENAERIQDGDIFRARVKYVEGRKVVTLYFGGMEE